MSLSKMKVGVVGYGYWGPNLVRNFLSHPEVENVVVCEKSPARLQKVVSTFHGVEIEADFNQFIRRSDIGAIAIATPVSTHFEFAKAALENGKHVLVEKPFTRTLAQADALIELAESKGLTIMVDHTFLFTGAVQKMKQLVDAGEIGDTMYFDSVRANLGLFQSDVNVIWDLAPHDLSILHYLVRERPVAVSAIGMKHFNSHSENLAYMTVYYDKPILAHFHVNWVSPVKLRTICMGGSKKMILFDDMQTSEKIRVYDKGVDVTTKEGQYEMAVQYRSGDMYAPQIGNVEALTEVAKHFLRCIEKKQKPICDGIAGREIVSILEATDLSLRESGRPVEIKSFR